MIDARTHFMIYDDYVGLLFQHEGGDINKLFCISFCRKEKYNRYIPSCHNFVSILGTSCTSGFIIT